MKYERNRKRVTGVTCICGNEKDTRAVMCRECQMKHNHPRQGYRKGTSHVNTLGYETVCVGPRGHWRHKHTVMMEDYLKCTLAPEFIVHHIDGDKLNNTLDNLQVVTRKEHGKIHRPGR